MSLKYVKSYIIEKRIYISTQRKNACIYPKGLKIFQKAYILNGC